VTNANPVTYKETMTRTVLAFSAALATCATLTVGAAVGAAKPVNCGSISVGPGALVHGSTSGANCLLRSYQQHCLTATYKLSRFGVDTISISQFRVVTRTGRCQIAVTTSFRVVPQRPHTTGHGYCRTIGRRNGDIVVGGCTGTGLQATISLTGRR
jgi:hypothetical protein